MIGEVYLNSNESHTSFFGYSSCSKVPWGEEAWSYDMQMVTGISIICITFGLNIALFVRKRQLETIREEGIMVVHYSHDGVTISRRKEDEPSSHKLRNFNRTVVTPKASFILFLTNALDYFILTFIQDLNTQECSKTVAKLNKQNENKELSPENEKKNQL